MNKISRSSWVAVCFRSEQGSGVCDTVDYVANVKFIPGKRRSND